jgi:hypothetical protein
MKEFTTLYYNIATVWIIDYNQIKFNIEKSIWNQDGYEIIKNWKDAYFIHLVKKHK